MQVHFGVELLRPEWDKAVVCIGTFDGVHVGHQQVIGAAVARAKELEIPVIVVTFDRHPAVILNPSKAPKAIASLKMNLEQLQVHGVGLTVVLPFNAWLSRMSADEFFQSILLDKLKAEVVVVGHDFAMGNGREGNTEWLQSHIETVIVPPYEVGGIRVSSSAIREFVGTGELDKANQLLGRGFEVQGFVEHGQKLGRTLGFPTANIARSFDQVMPCDGVYAAWFLVDGKKFMAALAIGTRPAVGGKIRTIEAYLLDYPGDSLYGQHVRLRLEKFLRSEADFTSLDHLKDQIEKDVVAVRLCLT
ncbi:MAG: bifunctional riboflavin kinase/FAD synthetase [Armatimonadetes bacterium]|nr:bifunctional riboflavin kinase/FAD synthetase [Armatimonadota bacterium]